MDTSFLGRKWNGPEDEEGRPHGTGKMYEIRQQYGYKSYASVDEYYADGYFDSAGRFISAGSTPRSFGDPFPVLLFEGECCHGEMVLRGGVIHREKYRVESVYADGAATDDFVIYYEGRKEFEGQADVSGLLSGFRNASPKYIRGKSFYDDGVSVKFEGDFNEDVCRYVKGKLRYPDGTLWFEGEFNDMRPVKGKVYRRTGTLWWEGKVASAAFYCPDGAYVSFDHEGDEWAYLIGEGLLYDKDGENPKLVTMNNN